MKQPFYIFAILLFFGFYSCEKKSQKNDNEGFNRFLGYEKSKAMNEAMESFDKFLISNYPDQDSQSSRIEVFLRQLQNSFSPDSTWSLKTEENIKILENWEKSGIRSEIWIYDYEEYQPTNNIHELLSPQEPETPYDLDEHDFELLEEEIIPIIGIDSVEMAISEKEMLERLKNSPQTNIYGEFLYGLAKFAPNDSVVQGYVEVKVLAGDISPLLTVSALLEHKIEYDEPFIKRVILAEMYYWIMKRDIEGKVGK